MNLRQDFVKKVTLAVASARPESLEDAKSKSRDRKTRGKSQTKVQGLRAKGMLSFYDYLTNPNGFEQFELWVYQKLVY